MSQAKATKAFYNAYGQREWERLFRTPQDKLNFILHMDFLKEVVEAGKSILDAGCGAGRFSVELTKMACPVTMLDISEEQIRLAKDKVEEHGDGHYIKDAIVGDISNLHQIKDDHFDVTICYGAPLSYLYDNFDQGIKELYRVTKPGGKVLVSVNSRLGVVRTLMGRQAFDIVDFLSRKDYWHVDQVVDEGNLPKHEAVNHPPRHFFEATELSTLFEQAGFKRIEMGSSPCLSVGAPDKVELISKDEKAWATLIELELKSYKRPTTLDMGEFLMIKGEK